MQAFGTRPLPFLLLLLVGFQQPLLAGSLVRPGGAVAVLEESSGPEGTTLQFPRRTILQPSWLVLPAGTMIKEATLATARGRITLTFPSVAAPGVRFGFEVPGQLLSLTLRGQLPQTLTLVQTPDRPGSSADPWITRSLTDLRIDLPSWRVADGFTPLLALVHGTQTPWEATVSEAGRSRRFAFQPSVRSWSFAPAAWGFSPTRIQLPGNVELSEVRVTAVAPGADIQTDPTTLLAWPAKAWREPRREWFSWAGTSVLVLVTADYKVQDDYLKRLAFFVEKTGYRGRLVPDEEIATQHGWNAHDYAAPDLARFFTKAAAESFPLNPSELELRERLVASGVLVSRDGRSWEAGSGALVGISESSPPALRAVFFVHEGFHGLYYTTPAFREGVRTAWSSLSEGARAAFRSFLALAPQWQYDPTDEALMINEFQAYVLQRPRSEWRAFFRDRVLKHDSPALEEFLAAAEELDALVGSLFGLRSGEVSLVKAF